LLLQSIPPGRTIARLFIMGGTVAKFSVGQAVPSGHHAIARRTIKHRTTIPA
jgi:hypothetical protein